MRVRRRCSSSLRDAPLTVIHTKAKLFYAAHRKHKLGLLVFRTLSLPMLLYFVAAFPLQAM